MFVGLGEFSGERWGRGELGGRAERVSVWTVRGVVIGKGDCGIYLDRETCVRVKEGGEVKSKQYMKWHLIVAGYTVL